MLSFIFFISQHIFPFFFLVFVYRVVRYYFYYDSIKSYTFSPHYLSFYNFFILTSVAYELGLFFFFCIMKIFLQPHFSKFTGSKNYNCWSIQMKVLFQSQDL